MPYKENGIFGEPDNSDRAGFAQAALAEYCRVTRYADPFPETGEGQDDEDREALATLVQDLLGDLRHLCDENGVDFQQALDDGMGHYHEEKEEAGA